MSVPLPPLQGTRLALAPHRLLPLGEGRLGVLAERGTGWCVLPQEGYPDLVQFFEALPAAGAVPEEWEESLSKLWDVGLLLSEGKANPATGPARPSYPTSLVIKLTGACNFDCTYCYDYDRHRFRARQSFARVCETLDRLLPHVPDLDVTFHGGEPLLELPLIERIVAYTREREGESPRVHFSIQTNGSLLDDHTVEFLETHDFGVGISIDGIGDETNRLRPVRGRQPSAWAHVERLFARYPDFVRRRCGFLAVVSRASAESIPDLALWLQDQGVRGFSTSFLDLAGRAAGLGHEKLAPEEAVNLYARLAGLVRDGSIQSLALRNLLSQISNLFNRRPRNLCHKGPCGAAGEFLILDAEGAFRTCDCIYDPYFELGSDLAAVENDQDHPARRAIEERHDWLRRSGADCRTCPLFGLCGGTCVAKVIASHGNALAVDPIECAINRWLYPLVLKERAAGGGPLLAYAARHGQAPAAQDQ